MSTLKVNSAQIGQDARPPPANNMTWYHPAVLDGVQYERLSVMLLSIIQEQEKRISSLEAK